MAKPILVITIQSGESEQSASAIQKIVKKTVDNEYHVIVVSVDIEQAPKFEVFYEKDFNEVKYEELKSIITNKLKQ